MRYVTLGAFVLLFMGAAVSAQAPDAQIMAPIQKFMDSFNKGDMAGAAATHAAGSRNCRSPTRCRPTSGEAHRRSKPGAATWPPMTRSLASPIRPSRSVRRRGSKRAPIRPMSSCRPSTRFSERGGVAMRESAQMTFALKKGASGWLIYGWTWTGPKPQKVAAPAKH